METVKTGTTTVGILCSDGVILAADTKVTLGHLVDNIEFPKIYEIRPHIGMTTAGSVADAQRLIKILRAQTALYEIERSREISVDATASMLGNILQNNKYYPYYVGLILGGFDSKPKLFTVDAVGGLVPQKIAFDGSGSEIALGVLHSSYKENATVKEMIPVAIKAVQAAKERDVYSGGKFPYVAVINKSGLKFLKEEEIKQSM